MRMRSREATEIQGVIQATKAAQARAKRQHESSALFRTWESVLEWRVRSRSKDGCPYHAMDLTDGQRDVTQAVREYRSCG